MTVNWSNNQILSKKRKGTQDDPFISIEESLTCVNCKIILSEVPNFSQKVILNYSEEYSSVVNYVIGDLVYYEISGEKYTYECTANCLNKIPTNTSYWTQINFVEVLNNNKALNKYEYFVDYLNCIVSLHPYFSNKNLICKYLGAGLELIPVTKVWTKSEGGDVLQTLAELIDTSAKSITFHTTPPTVSDGADGDVWFVYQE